MLFGLAMNRFLVLVAFFISTTCLHPNLNKFVPEKFCSEQMSKIYDVESELSSSASSNCWGSSGTFFQFLDDAIDVVIPCVEKDREILDLCIDGIRKYGNNIRRVIVVSKKPLTDKAEWFSETAYPFSLQEVALALSKENPTTGLFVQSGDRTGWYFQQLLKLYAPLVIPDISSNVLILDADVIFLNRVDFLNANHAGLYNPGEEFHLPYFEHGARLIPGFHKCFMPYSGISHHMIFQRSVIDALFAEVESYHSRPFWKIFCELVDPQHLLESGASEYEIYFNYVFLHTNQVSIRKLNWKNIVNLKEVRKLKKRGYDYIAIHSYCRIGE